MELSRNLTTEIYTLPQKNIMYFNFINVPNVTSDKMCFYLKILTKYILKISEEILPRLLDIYRPKRSPQVTISWNRTCANFNLMTDETAQDQTKYASSFNLVPKLKTFFFVEFVFLSIQEYKVNEKNHGVKRGHFRRTSRPHTHLQYLRHTPEDIIL